MCEYKYKVGCLIKLKVRLGNADCNNRRLHHFIFSGMYHCFYAFSTVFRLVTQNDNGTILK